MYDLYRPILAKILFPAFEALRKRPTVPLTSWLQESERWSTDALHDMQTGFLRRLVRHAHVHSPYYRQMLDERGLTYVDFNSPDDVAKLPLLDRKTLMATLESRVADAPPYAVITKRTSGSSGEPAV